MPFESSTKESMFAPCPGAQGKAFEPEPISADGSTSDGQVTAVPNEQVQVVRATLYVEGNQTVSYQKANYRSGTRSKNVVVAWRPAMVADSGGLPGRARANVTRRAFTMARTYGPCPRSVGQTRAASDVLHSVGCRSEKPTRWAAEFWAAEQVRLCGDHAYAP